MRKLLGALGATFVMLLATGLFQAFRYRPRLASPGFWYEVTEWTHRLAAYVFAALVFVVVIRWIVRARGTTRSALITVVVLTVLALATLAAIITGRGIRWTQLALWAVAVGDDIRGVVGLEHVKYVLLGTTEIAWSEFSSRVFLHLVLFPIGLVLVGGVLWFLSARDDRQRASLGGSPGAPDCSDDDTDLAPDVSEAAT